MRSLKTLADIGLCICKMCGMTQRKAQCVPIGTAYDEMYKPYCLECVKIRLPNIWRHLQDCRTFAMYDEYENNYYFNKAFRVVRAEDGEFCIPRKVETAIGGMAGATSVKIEQPYECGWEWETEEYG